MLEANSDSNCLGLFQLFIIEAHPTLIVIHTNLDLKEKQVKNLREENQKSGDDKPEYLKEELKCKENFEVRIGNVDPKKHKNAAYGIISHRIRWEFL